MRSWSCRAVLLSLAVFAAQPGCDSDPGGDQADLAMPDLVPPFVPSPFGLDARPANPGCVAPNRPPTGSMIAAQRFPNMNVGFNTPIDAHQAPGDPSTWYIAEKNGLIRKFPNMANITGAQVVDYLDITARVNATKSESGLLSFAFHPQFATNKKVFVSYTANGPYLGRVQADNVRLRSTVSWFPDTGGVANPAAETKVFPSTDVGDNTTPGELDQPYENHNGGYIAFGPGGYLFYGLGDGGLGGDPEANGQNKNTLLGKIHRVDVDTIPVGKRYGIPSTNPYAVTGGRPEIYAMGLRNPWRWSFDRGTGELWLGDVGQETWEEIDKVSLGGNYGWRFREGMHCYNPGSGCPTAGLIEPLVEYTHNMGRASIAGGFVYRGKAIPSLVGTYLFADTFTGEIFTIGYDGAGKPSMSLLLDTSAVVYGFTEDVDGELYLISGTGQMWKLVPAGTPQPDTFPKTLSATGCVDAQDATKPASGLIPFDVSAPLWSDGADKRRWLALPDGKQITVGVDGDFDFPNGTVLMKEFSLAGKRVETRLFMRHSDGGWAGYSYEWNDAGSDAALLPAGKTKVVGSQSWTYPGRNECVYCHTQAAGGSLGPEVLQLNHDFDYVATLKRSNQLATFDHIGLFDKPLADPTTLPSLPSYDSSAPIEARARAYFHANCSNCHRPMSTGQGPQDFRFGTGLKMTMLCNQDPQSTNLGIAGAKLVFPGDPLKSIVSVRMHALDANRMPPLATAIVDSVGAKLVDDWISSLTSCP